MTGHLREPGACHRVVLVYPDYRTTSVFGDSELPVGLGYVAEALESADVPYRVVDLCRQGFDDLELAVRSLSATILAVSMMTYRCRATYELIDKVKASFPGLFAVVGGPHVAAMGERVLEDCPGIDVAVLGEGEDALVDLATGRSPEAVPGVYFRENGEVRFTGHRPFIEDLDSVPFPRYGAFDLSRYSRIMPIHTSRGCPYRCIFCGAPRLLGRKWRARSARSILEEIETWSAKGYKAFYISDSNLGVDRARLEELCNGLSEREPRLSFTADGLRADHFDRSLLEHMRRAGFASVTFGVESARDRVLHRLRKGESVVEIRRAVSAAVELGFEVRLFFVVGSPGETLDDVHASTRFATAMNISGANFFVLTAIPGTEYYDWAVANGLVDGHAGYPEGNFGLEETADHATDAMTPAEFREALHLVRRVERMLGIRRRLQLRTLALGRGRLHLRPGAFNCVSWILSHEEMPDRARRLILRL